ncbi:hypothetical protein GDO78_012615 [Eleutherodactylus coqui]|uniref:Laminin subunit alpha-2 n=1 Tax=Eleutherodactylus coqui TaxID=57060 RepID=A0A8J6K4M3_ELECQ|nr:hypothetical protein GDO78_012615 [Eleutherodactylus coqui]
MLCQLLLVLLLCAGVQCQLRGLFPAILNLASNADITTNATCGESGPEMFCKLVEHVPGRIVRNPQCRICDQNSVNPKERHPITNANDGTNDWWQSPSIQNGREYHWVTITLDLKQVFQVAYVIIKAANSPRPGNWILERSTDGVEYMPWQYYAISDTECLTRYNVTPRLGPPTYKRDDEVICTSYYSKLVPLEHGEYYYSIKDISVGGMCICYGHARSCPWDEVTKKLQCQCERNTCGESCNECCPGYHQNPWRPGTISIGNKCEKCNCHNKAEDCYYDQTVADRNMSMNIHDQYIGGGVCMNCTQFTAGINCETCIEGYFRPHKVSPYTDDPCRPCECDPFGSISSACVADDKHAKPGVLPGQCQCKEGYRGAKCDQCDFGYKGYPNCVRCNCSLIGSVNEDPCAEQCICKEHVEGQNCDRCKAGYYNLQEQNPEGCTECFCFGVSGVCDELFWHTTQMTDIRGWHVTDLYGAERIQPRQDQFDGPHQISINYTEARKTLQSVLYWEAPHSYLGNKLTSFGGTLKYTVSYDIPPEGSEGEMISNVDVVIQGSGITIGTKSDGLLLQPFEEHTAQLKLIPERFVDFYTRRPVDRDRLMTILANVNRLWIRASYNTIKNASCIPGYYRVGGTLFGGICQPCECNGHATECDIHGICYGCLHNTTGLHCNQCLPGFYGDPTDGKPSDCQPCACPLTISSNNFSPTCYLSNDEDVICDQCAPGYTGAQCEKCTNGYFGNPLVPGGSCALCECHGNIDVFEDGHCDSLTGECLKCIGNTAGRHCEICAEGFYGDAILGKNCTACGCHPDSSVSAICHYETGLCECKPNVFGKRCDQCEPGFYGLTSGLGCLPCNCSQLGSVSEMCNHAGQCPCVAGVAGDKCDICAHGFYGYEDGGCTPCNCAHTQNNCNLRTGECICPPNTHGPRCEYCDANYWGHDAELGCLECNCSREGASRLQCDLTTGQCPCREEFGGQTCNTCLFGYRKYPHCIYCDCDAKGTQSAWCDDEQKVCSCEEETGACACKENVIGSYCNECKSGTFAIRTDNPLGCSPCFCSGVSQLCAEIEDYVHIPISLVPGQSLLRVVSPGNMNGTTDGVFSEEVDMLLDASVIRQTLQSDTFYWQLSGQFLGDKLMSYGGVMTYVVTYYALADSGPSDVEPHIVMRGGHLTKLTISLDKPSPAIGIRSEMKIPMKEDNWKYHKSGSENSVTRKDFMSVLSNVDYILIKASYGYGVQQSRISNISMDVAVEAAETHSGREAAHLIEICECPPGYAGLSCQECAPGYYREKVTEVNLLEPQPYIAPCVPCQCTNHSGDCDPQTGECIVSHVAVLPALYFSPTCILEGTNDFRCDACLPGYEGRHCEQCSLGYFGNPREPDGSCQLCDCNPAGSLNNDCDRITGQCSCKPGVTGRLCDACEVRHILLDQHCKSCDDDCTGPLLDDLDDIHQIISSLNLTGNAVVPSGFMSHLENMTTHIQMTQVTEHGYNVHNSTLSTLNKSQELMGFINKIQTAVKVLREVAESLNKTIGSDIRLSDSTMRDYQEDVSSKLESMSTNGFDDLYQNATKSLKDCEDLLFRVQNMFEKPQKDLLKLMKSLENTLEQHNNSLLAAKDFIQESASKTNSTKNLLIPIQKNLKEFYVKKLTLQENKNHSVMLIEEGLGLVDEAVLLAEDTINATSALEMHQEMFIMWNTKLRHHVDELVMQMSRRDVLDLVYKAEDHATSLQSLADSLNSSLSGMRNNSLNATNAVQAHSGIKSMIEQADAVVEQANSMVAGTASGPKGSLGSVSKNSINVSTKLLDDSKNLSQNTEGLVSRLKGLKTKVDNIQKSTHAFTRQLNEHLRALRTLPNDTSTKLQDAKDLALSANASAADTLSHIINFSQKLTNATSTLSRVNDTLQKTNELLIHSSRTAVTAESRIKEVETQANILLDRLKPLKLLEENLSRNLSEIKELINQARKQAASIKVAVSADRDCVRSYHPEIRSTNFNTLTLNVKTNEADNLLFYLGSNTQADFMAVEMQKGKVSFLWDLGTGVARIEDPDIQIDNSKWHKIHATRFGRSGTLSVEEVASSQKTSPKTLSSPGTSSILHVDNSTLMFVGGIGSGIQKSATVRTSDFKGCIGEAFLNGKSIGLWNYVQRHGKCDGCYGSPQDEDISFYFDGSGYSIVEKTLRSTTTQIFIHFRTFSPNGLLLYLASNGTRDFLSLEIVDGKLRLSVELGSGPLILTTDGRYNDGTWYKVAFQRNKKQGMLAVMDSHNSSQKETKQGEAPGTASDLNRSDKDPIYIGGLPRSRVIRRQLSSRSYVGCIRNLEISRSNFDLQRNAYGVRKGCILEPTRSITVLNDGYVEMEPVSLSPESELMVSFSTLNETGIILAGFGKSAEKRSRRQAQLPFFAIMLVNGHIEFHIHPMDGASTRKVVVRSPTGTYNDGQEHSFILLRNKRMVSVQVDEGKPIEVRLNGPSVESLTIKTSSFFIGGVPAKMGATMLKTSQSFHGCVQDLILNMEQMDFTTVVKYENVQMDSCMLTEKPIVNHEEQDLPQTPVPAGPVTEVKPHITTAVLRPHVTKPLQCAQDILPAYVPDSHQFGLTRGSHIILPFDPSTVRKRLSVQLSLRTFATSGLIYYMAHQNQVDYAALQLHEGRLHYLFDMGKGRTETTHSAVINDGKWHTITTEYHKRKSSISVDGQESASINTSGESNTLDVEGKLYLGGLSPSYTAKNIGNVTHSIPACISNVTINSKQLDKNGATSIYAVKKCYASAQDGTYFDGSGFAALVREGYKVRSDVNISLEFRTTSLNGVLLGISSAKVDAIGLEIVNGRVLFHVNNGAGRITAIYKPEDSDSICDGKWHQVQANKVKHKILLTVDGNAVQVESLHVQSTSADTNNPIFVGGYPGGVKQNCLTSQTSFRGCIRNMKLMKGTQIEADDFSRSFDMRGVFPHSCPGTEL